MTSLAELQSMFSDAMFGDNAAVNRLGEHVEANEKLSGTDHVRIYRQTVLGTLTASLANVFPVTRRLVGEQFFDAMAARFIPGAPSNSADLANYGSDFPPFIAAFEPAAELPYLADVALLEWHWHRAFNAADQPPLDSEALRQAASLDPARLLFRLPASATLIESDYPILRIWEVNQPEHEAEGTVELDTGADRLIVWRPSNSEIRIDRPNADEWLLLCRVAVGDSLEELSAVPDFATLLPRCAQRGWLGDFETR